MHMSDALVSVAVGSTMTAVSAGLVGYSIKKVKSNELNDQKIPMMGVMGAFVFAAQMINFSIPVTGSSGHIGGGMLLAALLGPFPAFLTLASVLLIQALFFADGGLLALGCNIFNMGFYSCILAFSLIYRPILKKGLNTKRIMLASMISVVISLQLGAFSVVLETSASGVTELPFLSFVALMQPIHLAIGIVEGLATGAVLSFIYSARKEILQNAIEGNQGGLVSRKFIGTFALVTVIFGGIFSLYASSEPDGLEWSIQNIIGEAELDRDSTTHEKAKILQEKTALLPDYSFKEGSEEGRVGTSISGIVGAVFTLFASILVGLIILKMKNSKKDK